MGCESFSIIFDVLKNTLNNSVVFEYGDLFKFKNKGCKQSGTRNIKISLSFLEHDNVNIGTILNHSEEEGRTLCIGVENIEEMKKEIDFYKHRNLFQRLFNKHYK